MHLAPTASKRIYQQRVGRVTRRHPGKEAGIVVDFVAPDTKNDDPVVTLHSLLDRDVYRGGAIVVGPVRRGRGRRVRVERRVLPVTSDEDRRIEVFERELWRIAVEHLPYGEQIQWAALAGARVAPSGWRRARAMLHFDRTGEFKRAFLLTAVQRNKNPQLRIRALQEIAASRDGEAFDTAIDVVGTWTRDERREGTKVMLLALAEKRIGRRDQANAWIWRLASYTREVHEEYAVQRWPETKRLLGLLVNSSGAAHARNARRLVHAARKQDRRLSAALLAAAIAHTPEGEEMLRGARTRLARKPSALSRELLRNFPKSRGRRGSRRRRKKGGEGAADVAGQQVAALSSVHGESGDAGEQQAAPRPSRRRSRSRARTARATAEVVAERSEAEAGGEAPPAVEAPPADSEEPGAQAPPKAARGSRVRKAAEDGASTDAAPAKPARGSRVRKAAEDGTSTDAAPAKPARGSRVRKAAGDGASTDGDAAPAKPARGSRARKTAASGDAVAAPVDDAQAVEAIAGAAATLAAARGATKPADGEAIPPPKRRRRTKTSPEADGADDAPSAEPESPLGDGVESAA
jgi:ribonuclease E